MLAAGIDVLSTLNVQHLESLNDQIAELSGVRVRETIPDAVLGRADEMVLVDLTPEALLDRLRAGKVYPPERIDAALNNFFRIENLAALREVALRQVAEEVGAQAPDHRRTGRAPRGDARRRRPASGRRAAARAGRAVSRAPSGWCAARGARRSGSAPTSTCCGCVRPARACPTSRSARSTALQPARLGARRAAADRGVRRRARDGRRGRPPRGTTYILLGRSRPARGLARLRTPLPQRLMELLPGVDVRIVADRSRAPRAMTEAERTRNEPGDRDRDRRGGACWRVSPPATGCRPTGDARRKDRPAPGAHDPAAVHRPGDLAPRVRGRGPPRQGRERDDRARPSSRACRGTCRSTRRCPPSARAGCRCSRRSSRRPRRRA